MKRSTRLEYERRVLRAQQHIERALPDAPDPATLARVACLSKHHFHRVFRGVTGESVMEYARRLRLERAARQLRSTTRDILPVAIDAGYGSHEAFTRDFADRFGVTPSAYRAGEAASPSPACRPARPVGQVELRRAPERVVLCMRHRGPYERVSATWHALVAWYRTHAATLGLPAELPPMFGLVPDDPHVTPVELLRYDAALAIESVPDSPLPDGPVAVGRVPEGLYAVIAHRGPYDTLHEAYLALIGGWIVDEGHALAAEPTVERYLNDPQHTAPEDLVTEVGVRIEERGWLT